MHPVSEGGANSAGRTLESLAALSREVARATSRQELLALAANCLRTLGVRGWFAELEGDSVRLVAEAREAERLTRVERILGQPLSALSLRTHSFPIINEAASRRHPATCDDITPGFATLVPHLSNRDRLALRSEVGLTPCTAIPIETGDDLLGVLLTWQIETDDTVSTDIPTAALQLVAAQLGPAWERLGGAAVQAKARRRSGRATSTSLRQVLSRGDLRTALQPIVRLLDGVTLGYEALCRVPADAGLESPTALFDDAAACGLELELDAACLRSALRSAVDAAPATLFLNITLPTLLQRGVADTLAELVNGSSVAVNNVVLEVSERIPIPNVARLRRIVADLRARGFRIAIDDAGAGHASMLVIAEVRPDFIKIDRDLIHGIHSNGSRRALVVSMLSFGTHINTRVVAEGIETEADLRTLIDLGVQFGQGRVLSDAVVVGGPPVDDALLVDKRWFADRRTANFPSVVDPEEPARVRRAVGVAEPNPANESLPHALNNAALALQAEHDPERILSVIAEQLQRVVPVDDLSIYAADHTNHRFVPAFATGRQAAQIMEDVFSMSVGVTGWAFAQGAPQNLGNAGAHPAAAAVPNTPFEHESLLLIPLVAGDHKLGMLNCRRMGLNRFTDEDFEAASLFGHTAAAAWHNAQLYEELERRAMTDNLTGLFNSRWLHEAADRELADARRRGAAASLVLVDLDHFKTINDTAGHEAGDLVLQRVAAVLRGGIRGGDAAVRLGGEEFVLVLRDTHTRGAVQLAEQLRAAITAVDVPPACTGVTHLTASFGVATFPDHAAQLSDLVRAADVAMYQAKRGGRDQVCIAESHEVRSAPDRAIA